METAVDTASRRRIWMTAGVIALLVLALWFATRIPKTVAIFVIAAFVASAVAPVVNWLERHRVARVWAITLVYTLLILVTIVVLVIVVPLSVVQSQALIENTPGYLHTMQTWVLDLQATLQRHFRKVNIPPQLLNFQTFGAQRINELISGTIASLGVFALNIATGLFIAFSALILSFFFLLNHERLAEGFAGFFPPSKRATARKLSTEAVGVFGGYIAGQVIVSGITGLIIGAITAAFGFKFALLVGILSAIGYSIPIVGMLVAQFFALLLSAPQGVFMIVLVQGVMFGMARISDSILVPKIMGGSVGVSPITVMFAVFAGGELFGLPGLILGIPAAAIAKLFWRYFLSPWLHGQIDAVDQGQPEPLAVMEDPLIEPIVVIEGH
jgi:predicted PurR-regulated permease PerM